MKMGKKKEENRDFRSKIIKMTLYPLQKKKVFKKSVQNKNKLTTMSEMPPSGVRRFVNVFNPSCGCGK